MHIINNHILVPVKGGNNLLIHTLKGFIDVLNEEEIKIFEKWKHSKQILPNTIEEIELLESLIKKNYIVESLDVEIEMEKCTLEKSKIVHEKILDKCYGVFFVLTYNCNFRCPYCYEKGNENKVEGTMSKDMVDTIFSIHNNEINNIILYGGEPLLPENEEVIRYIITKAPKAKYSVTTNGYYLEEYLPIFKNLDIDYMMVTLDGLADLHNKTRYLYGGGNTYQKIIKGIDEFLNKGKRIKIRMNISDNNIDSCIKLKSNLIKEYRLAYENDLLLFEMQPIFQLDTKKRQVLQYRLYYSDGDHIEKGKPMHYRENTMIQSLSALTNIFTNPNKKTFNPKYCNCDAESGVYFYDAKGNVYSCILALGNEKASIGRYYPSYELKKNSMRERNIETVKRCQSCKLKFICGGGCGYAVLEDNGDVMKPNCEFILNEINESLPTLYEKYVKDI